MKEIICKNCFWCDKEKTIDGSSPRSGRCMINYPSCTDNTIISLEGRCVEWMDDNGYTAQDILRFADEDRRLKTFKGSIAFTGLEENEDN